MQMEQPSPHTADDGSPSQPENSAKNPKIAEAIAAVHASGLDPVAIRVAVATLEAMVEADSAKKGEQQPTPAKNMTAAADNIGNAMYKGGQNNG